MNVNAIRPDGPTIAIEHQATGEQPVTVTPEGTQPAAPGPYAELTAQLQASAAGKDKKVLTNGDRWRSMTDREIARWIVRNLKCELCPLYSSVFSACGIDSNNRVECWDAVEKWCGEEAPSA